MGNLIKFPTDKIKKSKVNAIKPNKAQAKVIKENQFIEQLTEKFTLDFITVLQQNAVRMGNEPFLRDLAIVIESIKSLLSRDFGHKHPMQNVTDCLAKITTLPGGKQVTDLNYGKIFVTKKSIKPPEPPLTT
jgi:hypothetical protein